MRQLTGIALGIALLALCGSTIYSQEKKAPSTKFITSCSQKRLLEMLEKRVKLQKHETAVSAPVLGEGTLSQLIVLKTSGPEIYFGVQDKDRYVQCMVPLSSPKFSSAQLNSLNKKLQVTRAFDDNGPTLRGGMYIGDGITEATLDGFLRDCFVDIDAFFKEVIASKKK